MFFPSAGKVALATAGSERLTVDPLGKVGIGTGGPSHQLHVLKATSSNTWSVMENPNATASAQASMQAVNDTGAALHFTKFSSGNPTPKLGVIQNNSGPLKISVYAAEPMIFENSNNVERMRLTPSGNLGVGLTNPSYMIQSNGGVAGNGAYANTSDRRLKKNVRPIEAPLSKLLRLRGVHFDWRQDEFPDRQFGQIADIGVIAQEGEKVFPEAVSQDREGIRAVAYSKLIAPLIEAMREVFTSQSAIQAENEVLRKKIDALTTWTCAKDPSAPFCE